MVSTHRRIATLHPFMRRTESTLRPTIRYTRVEIAPLSAPLRALMVHSVVGTAAFQDALQMRLQWMATTKDCYSTLEHSGDGRGVHPFAAKGYHSALLVVIEYRGFGRSLTSSRTVLAFIFLG